ncbi:hypothetical protein C8R43DRAFT_1210304 [Mycena crocata]|nr:hypothetical protein C8R43DRAFT_1210304 [Mycena crocata]
MMVSPVLPFPPCTQLCVSRIYAFFPLITGCAQSTLVKKLAQTAADGSLDDLMYIGTLTREARRHVSRLFLPAFYAHLNPIKAENLEAQEVLSAEQATPIILAFVAIQGLSSIQGMPEDAMPHLWPGFWTWAQLVVQHAYCLSLSLGCDLAEVQITILRVIGYIHGAKTASKLIAAEPGVLVLVAKAWVMLSRPGHALEIRASGCRAMWYLLHWLVCDTTHVEELIEGSGGTLGHFASTIVGFVMCAAENGRVASKFLHYTLGFIYYLDERYPGVKTKLMARGVVHAVVRSILVIKSRAGRIEDDYQLDDSFHKLLKMMMTPPGHAFVAEALDAGFLRLISTAVINSEDTIPYEVKDLIQSLTFVLGRHIPYHSILSRLKSSSLAEVVNLVDCKGSRTSAAWETWRTFSGRATERIQLLNPYESDKYIPLKACDNAEYGTISVKSNFRCCSVCQSVCDCSVRCQIADWRRGHRAACKDIRLHWLMNPDTTSSRDRSFFRYILHRDYISNIQKILRRELVFLNAHPGEAFYTAFDFGDPGTGNGKFTLATIPCSDTSLDVELGPIWRDWVARAAASDGRIHLHVMNAAEGTNNCARVIPLRAKSPALRKGLLSLSREFPQGTPLPQVQQNVPHIWQKLDNLIAQFGVNAG